MSGASRWWINCSAASLFLVPFMTKKRIASAPWSERAFGPSPLGLGRYRVSSAIGFLSKTALANIVPAFEVYAILPARNASLLLGSTQALTPGGNIGAHFESE